MKNKNQRYIKFNYVWSGPETMAFKIVSQTHRVENFTPNGNVFYATNGVIFQSQAVPWYPDHKKLIFVRGMEKRNDGNVIEIPKELWGLIIDAEKEYNMTNGCGYSTELPKLSAKALDALKVSWPKWSTCAVVNSSGNCVFLEDAGATPEETKWNFLGRHVNTISKWDASDWPNSKIMNPEASFDLPGWCKAGNWVNFKKSGIGKISEVITFGRSTNVKVEFNNCRSIVGDISLLSPVDVIPWTVETAPPLIKVKRNGKTALAKLSVGGERWLYIVESPDAVELMTFEAILKYATRQNGLPCGTIIINKNGVSK
jgi:hypothetical protein